MGSEQRVSERSENAERDEHQDRDATAEAGRQHAAFGRIGEGGAADGATLGPCRRFQENEQSDQQDGKAKAPFQ